MLFLAFFFFASTQALAQEDTIKISPQEKVIFDADKAVLKDSLTHSPRKAMLMSAALPGLGQVYNKKYWKVPVIYAALGTITYFAISKHQDYRFYIEQYRMKVDDDPNTLDQFPGASPEQLFTVAEAYRRNRDLLIIVGSGVYLLNLLDAAVDAHLFYFNVSEDLSMQWSPGLMVLNSAPTPSASLKLRF